MRIISCNSELNPWRRTMEVGIKPKRNTHDDTMVLVRDKTVNKRV